MERHRHDDGGLGNQVAAGAEHPARHPGGEIEPVAVLQAVNKRARDIVVRSDRAAAIERRWVGDRLGGKSSRPKIVRKRDAEVGAIRLLDDTELRPASGTQRAAARHRRVAVETLGRQRKIEKAGDDAAGQFPGANGEQLRRRSRVLSVTIGDHGRDITAGTGADQIAPPLTPGDARIINAGMTDNGPSGPPRLFDRALLDRRRTRAIAQTTDGADFLLAEAADDILERLGAVKRQFALVADIGTPLPLLARQLAAGGQVERVVRLDRIAATQPDIVADFETLPLRAASLDLAVSALALQWADDLPGVLAQIRAALKPDGLFLAAFVGGESLTELRQSLAAAEDEVRGGASPRVSPFVELRSAGALLQRAGFALPVIDQDRRTVRYASALHLMRDLRAMGTTNVLHDRDRRPLPRAVLARAMEIYAERFSDPDGRVRATFDVISLSGWAPDASQPKPLKPGSASARLADALGSQERPAGEKAG